MNCLVINITEKNNELLNNVEKLSGYILSGSLELFVLFPGVIFLIAQNEQRSAERY